MEEGNCASYLFGAFFHPFCNFSMEHNRPKKHKKDCRCKTQPALKKTNGYMLPFMHNK